MTDARRRPIIRRTPDDGRSTVEIEVFDEGPIDGSAIVLVPSAGRAAADFDRLTTALAGAGRRVLRPEPRGIGASTGHRDDLTLAELADDHAAVIRSLDAGPALVLGHAYGNRIVRMLATRHPELVSGVALLACGGMVPMPEEMWPPFFQVFDRSLDPTTHLAAVATCFFADGNDPSVWADGWFPEVVDGQNHASIATPVAVWGAAGSSAPVLVVQPAADAIAPPRNAELLVELIGARAELVTIEGAGHALLPERPTEVAEVVREWADRIAPRAGMRRG